MRILAIETSCDETAVALLDITGPLEKPEIKVLGNSLISQAKLHEEYGGVYPNLAKREHQKNLPILLEQTLKEAGYELTHDGRLTTNDIDFITVTVGPGLEPALWTGITFAEELGKKWGKPVVPVNHMEGHIFSVLYHQKQKFELPALALLVSGGHTELVHIRGFGDYKIVGRTLDDAVGEAFDKVARMIGLSYPGGPKVSALAEAHRESGLVSSFKLPRPMLHSGNLDFSFSGLKTAVLYKIRAQENITDEFKSEIAREFEDSAVEVLVDKSRKALESIGDIKTFILAGGVSANTYLGQKVSELAKEFPELNLCIPERDLSTDNAIMIAIAGYVRVQSDPTILSYPQPLLAQGNLSLDL